jgi:hypothetical protein
MSNFLTSLWESIFTPGPTPTLLLATNATFGCLQLLLLILLLVTQSIHFIVLSFLCAGLWYAINWFAAEVAAVRAEEEKRAAEGEGGKDDREDKGKEGRRKEKSMSPEVGSDTETEEAVGTGREGRGAGRLRKAPPKGMAEVKVQSGTDEAKEAKDLLRPEAPSSSSPGMADSGTLARRRSLGESSGYVSTDSEWEKVDDDEARK